MAGLYESFETDPKTEREGIWQDYGSCRIRIARAGGSNKKYQKRLAAISHPYRRAIATDTLDPKTAIAIFAETYADAVILDWETKVIDDPDTDSWHWQHGIEVKGSVELLPATKQNIMAPLTALPELFRDLREQAESMTQFRVAVREEAAKNS